MEGQPEIKWLPWGRGSGAGGGPLMLTVARPAFAAAQLPPVKSVTVEATINAGAEAVLSFFSPDEVGKVGARPFSASSHLPLPLSDLWQSPAPRAWQPLPHP